MKILLATLFMALLNSITVMAYEADNFYGGISSDGDKRHQINMGYRFTNIFSLETSVNHTEWDNDRDDHWSYFDKDEEGNIEIIGKGNRYQTADKASAIMVWGKIRHNWTEYLAIYAKAGMGRFKLNHDYTQTINMDNKDPVISTGSRSLYRTGHGYAAGAEVSLTDNLYANLEYQHLQVTKSSEMTYRENGTIIGIGYKF